MIAVDTSIVVAAFASWHEAHHSASAIVARRPKIPSHVLVESYSVLTRLPPPHRAPSDLVHEFLRDRFPGLPLALTPRAVADLLDTVAELGLTGGAVYDALIGATAKIAGATLYSRDQRAQRVYDRIGVRYELVT